MHGEKMDFSHVEWWGPADLSIPAWTWSYDKWLNEKMSSVLNNGQKIRISMFAYLSTC